MAGKRLEADGAVSGGTAICGPGSGAGLASAGPERRAAVVEPREVEARSRRPRRCDRRGRAGRGRWERRGEAWGRRRGCRRRRYRRGRGVLRSAEGPRGTPNGGTESMRGAAERPPEPKHAGLYALDPRVDPMIEICWSKTAPVEGASAWGPCGHDAADGPHGAKTVLSVAAAHLSTTISDRFTHALYARNASCARSRGNRGAWTSERLADDQ